MVLTLCAAGAPRGEYTAQDRLVSHIDQTITISVMTGDRGKLTKPELGQDFATSLPRADFSLIKGAKHGWGKLEPAVKARLLALINE